MWNVFNSSINTLSPQGSLSLTRRDKTKQKTCKPGAVSGGAACQDATERRGVACGASDACDPIRAAGGQSVVIQLQLHMVKKEVDDTH